MNPEIVDIDITPRTRDDRFRFVVSFESISNNWWFSFTGKTDNALMNDPWIVDLLNNERFLCFKIDPISSSVEHVEKTRILLYFTKSVILTTVYENRNDQITFY